MDLSRYTALFLADGREHLKLAAGELLRWEERPAELAPVAELFRAFHSLKGSAASMGYQEVVAVAHASEHLLETIRRRERPASAAVIALLLRAVDTLERGLEPATRGEPIPDALALAEAIGRLASTTTPSLAPEPVPVEPKPARTEPKPDKPAMRAARIDPARLDELLQLAGELVVARNRLVNLAAARGDGELESVSGQIDSLVRSLHAGVLRARLAPITELFGRLPRVVRDLSSTLGKAAKLELKGEGIELDRTVLEELVDPLIHLVRNAVDHGIESAAERVAAGKPEDGRLVLAAERRRDWIVIRLSDDGSGVDRYAVARRAVGLGLIPDGGGPISDEQLLQILGRPGFSLKSQVTEVSGRGVGMDIVVTKVRALGGKLNLMTEPGRGTTFEITVPLTAAIQRVLLVAAGSGRFAIPFRLVREAMLSGGSEAEPGEGDRFTFRGRSIPLVDLTRAVGGGTRSAAARRPVLVLEWGPRDGALAVDALLGQHDVLLERIEAPRALPGWVSGATILADGAPAFVVDPTALF